MSYNDEFSLRMDAIQLTACFISRRFVHHTERNPLEIEFELTHEAIKDPSVELREYGMKKIYIGFNVEDLTVIQYGFLVAQRLEDLSLKDRGRLRGLEYEILGPSIVIEYFTSCVGQGNYSSEEILEVAKRLDNPLILARFGDVQIIDDFAKPIRDSLEVQKKTYWEGKNS